MNMEDIDLDISRLETAFLMAVAIRGYPTDMQGSLVTGSSKYGVPRGVLRAGIRAVLKELKQGGLKCHQLVLDSQARKGA
jgi:hypothetical protein